MTRRVVVKELLDSGYVFSRSDEPISEYFQHIHVVGSVSCLSFKNNLLWTIHLLSKNTKSIVFIFDLLILAILGVVNVHIRAEFI